MNIKKIYTKFFATTLALGTLTSVSPAQATPTLEDTRFYSLVQKETASTETKSIDELVVELKSIVPNVCLNPNFKNPEKADPELARKALSLIIKIFKMFPNITRKFVEQLNLTEDKVLEIDVLDSETDPLHKWYIDESNEWSRKRFAGLIYGNFSMTGIPMGNYYLSATRQKLLIHAKPQLYKMLERDIHYNDLHAPMDTDCLTHTVAITMGKLILNTIRYSKDPDSYKKLLEAYDTERKTHPTWWYHSIESLVRTHTITHGVNSPYYGFIKHIYDIDENIQKEIEHIALDTFYEPEGITRLGTESKHDSEHWFYEGFSYTICNDHFLRFIRKTEEGIIGLYKFNPDGTLTPVSSKKQFRSIGACSHPSLPYAIMCYISLANIKLGRNEAI